MRVSGNNLRVGLPANSPEAFKNLPRYKVSLALQAEGDTVRDMAGTANGYLRLIAGQGKVEASAARLLTNDFLDQLMNLVNPFATKQDPYTHLSCAQVLATLEGGRLEGKPILVVQTERVNIFADTKIDLQSEKLSASFNTVPQKGLGFSLTTLVNPYVAVIGTLGNPQISLDPEATLVQGGAAIATAGLSILAKGVKDRFLSSKTPCADALKKADKEFKILEKKYAKSIRKL